VAEKSEHRDVPETHRAFPKVKRASIKDIARQANVSHSTVSRALSDSPLISPDTAERIRRIAQENGYRPSAAARSLVTSRTGAIGVVVTSIADPFAAEVLRGIEDAANDYDYSVFLANSDGDAEREIKVVRSFEERRVEGIVVTSSRVGSTYAELLSQTRVPIVLLNNQHPSEFLHSVMIDNVQAAREAVAHLIALGHRRIGYLGDRFGCQSDTERFAGYRAALDEAGVAFRPEFVVHGDGKAEGGGAAMTALLDLWERPTGVLCYNDMTVLGALGAVRARGLTIPRDISLVGFDDLFFARYLDPPLTTVRQPMRAMGRMATETLRTLLAGSASAHNIKVPGELVVRSSTGKPKEIAYAAPRSS
jgi:DNA-binding LacI/PurR family transcriptional regulator